ncbi:SDR family NAD(P)-dependent oxidoreductase [Sphingomonas sp.]|uniref:SDR family NAD(P)-dependent oxidoreductase n=1 Tax=Sphingomonas sp. TaxID=28214 RepID=UPI0025FD6428|nr:SDR family NAD(P)-dependent oxidoreductase [Sphingomonas sp.]
MIGSSGGIGAAVADALDGDASFSGVIRLSCQSDGFDLRDEPSIERAAAAIKARPEPIRLIFVATGLLSSEDIAPEKSLRDLDAGTLATLFAINTIGPALVAKHFLPLLPRHGKSMFAALSARVGSIGDNQLGGWYGYRASKTALNQIIHTAAIELARSRLEAVCVTLHPGTVATRLSQPFAKSGLPVQSPAEAAGRLLSAVAGLCAEDTGGFFDHRGERIAW